MQNEKLSNPHPDSYFENIYFNNLHCYNDSLCWRIEDKDIFRQFQYFNFNISISILLLPYLDQCNAFVQSHMLLFTLSWRMTEWYVPPRFRQNNAVRRVFTLPVLGPSYDTLMRININFYDDRVSTVWILWSQKVHTWYYWYRIISLVIYSLKAHMESSLLIRMNWKFFSTAHDVTVNNNIL